MTPRRSKTGAWAQVGAAAVGLVGCVALWLGPVEAMVGPVAAPAPSAPGRPAGTNGTMPIGTTTSVPTGLIRPYSSPNPNDERALSAPTIAAVTVVPAPLPDPSPSSRPSPSPDPNPNPSSAARPVAPDSLAPSAGPLDGAGVEQRIIVEVPSTSTPITSTSIPDSSIPDSSIPDSTNPDRSIPESSTSTTETDAPRADPTPSTPAAAAPAPEEVAAAGPLPRTGTDGLALRLAVVALALIDGGWLVRSLGRVRRGALDQRE